jgi:hypothetical protein
MNKLEDNIVIVAWKPTVYNVIYGQKRAENLYRREVNQLVDAILSKDQRRPELKWLKDIKR